MSVAGGVKFYFTKFAENSRIIGLDVNRTWLNTTMDNVAIVQSLKTFGNVTSIFET